MQHLLATLFLPPYNDEANWLGDVSPIQTAQRYQLVSTKTVVIKNSAGQITALNNGKMTKHTPINVSAVGGSFNPGFFRSITPWGSIARATQLGASLSPKVI